MYLSKFLMVYTLTGFALNSKSLSKGSTTYFTSDKSAKLKLNVFSNIFGSSFSVILNVIVFLKLTFCAKMFAFKSPPMVIFQHVSLIFCNT